jgi:two-component system sensor histidine kinase AlgZ
VHPILADRGRLALYLAAWAPVGGLIAAALALPDRRAAGEAIGLALPLALSGAFLCLAVWPLCRSLPLGATDPARLVATHAAGATVTCVLWLLVGAAAAGLMERLPAFAGAAVRYRRDIPMLLLAGALVFVLAALAHYLMIAFERSRAAERAALELQVLARDAQLRALKAQVNPHFLFNSLNSISALTSVDPARAREMCVLLGDFLRGGLRVGEREQIPLSEELALAQSYLAVEQVRFGPRLRVETEVEPQARGCLVPPLLLQPLLENALNHGIAHCLSGGAVRLGARVCAGQLELQLANPCSADRPRGRGTGMGLANVRARLAALHPGDARVDLQERDGVFRVDVHLPAVGAEAAAAETASAEAATAVAATAVTPTTTAPAGGEPTREDPRDA